jgi:hypothetical protein
MPRSRAERAEAQKPEFDDGLKSLLDHVARELAQEYIRLMEAAADKEKPERPEGGEG